MQIRQAGDAVTLELGLQEQRLLRRALERASFIDTPPGEQADILAFCSRVLEMMPRT